MEVEMDGEMEEPLGLELVAQKLATRVMSNPLVLDKISKKLPVKDLSNLRQTCTSWNRAFVPRLRMQHGTIRLNTWNLTQQEKNGTRRQLKMFLDQFPAPGPDFPFTRYKIGDDGYSTRSQKTSTSTSLNSRSLANDLQQFVQTFAGNFITSLDMTQVWDEPSCSLRQILTKVAPTLYVLGLSTLDWWNNDEDEHDAAKPFAVMRNLKRLVLDGDAADISPSFTSAALQIIQNSPQLESLELRTVCDEKFLDPFLKGIEQSTLQRPNLLKSLGLCYVGLSVTFPLLIGMTRRSTNPLRLQYLSAEAGNWLDAEMRLAVQELLALHSGTMKQLKLKLCHGPSDEYGTFALPLIELPHMSALHSLELVASGMPPGGDDPEEGPPPPPDAKSWTWIGAPNVTFVEAFPSLKRVKMSIINATDHYSLSSGPCFCARDLETVLHPGVIELSLDCVLPDNVVNANYQRAFPSVTSLEVSVYAISDEVVAANLLSSWPGLTRLHLTIKDIESSDDFEMIDVLLTGVPASIRGKLKGRLNRFWWDQTPITLQKLRSIQSKYSGYDYPGHGHAHGLPALTQLQEFSLNLEDLDSYSTWTADLGVYFGVVLAGSGGSSTRLQHVSIQGSLPIEISDSCLAFLRAELGDRGLSTISLPSTVKIKSIN